MRAELRASAEDANLTLPWAGIFRPREPWRSLVLIAAAAERASAPSPFYYRRKRKIQRKKKSGRLQGRQLNLFPQEGSDPRFYRPATPPDPKRPLADLFPMAYE